MPISNRENSMGVGGTICEIRMICPLIVKIVNIVKAQISGN